MKSICAYTFLCIFCSIYYILCKYYYTEIERLLNQNTQALLLTQFIPDAAEYIRENLLIILLARIIQDTNKI